MDPFLIYNFIHFLNTKVVWDVIVTTYFDGADTFELQDLRRKVTRMRQVGGPIEKYYNNL